MTFTKNDFKNACQAILYWKDLYEKEHQRNANLTRILSRLEIEREEQREFVNFEQQKDTNAQVCKLPHIDVLNYAILCAEEYQRKELCLLDELKDINHEKYISRKIDYDKHCIVLKAAKAYAEMMGNK